MNEPTETDYVPAVLRYHRALATHRYDEAFACAARARDAAPCDGEAARWAQTARDLEIKCARGFKRLAFALGIESRPASGANVNGMGATR